MPQPPPTNRGPDVPSRNRRVVNCECCGRQGKHVAHGFIQACYDRWDYAGKPIPRIPPPGPQGRRDDYEDLTRSSGVTMGDASTQVGVSTRTAWRYESLIKQRGTA